VVQEPPLFLYTSEIIRFKKDTLKPNAFIQLLEVHDFTPLEDFDSDG
jgi:hypothetical protein